METMYPASYISDLNWLMQESKSTTKWTREENKRFESLLAIFDKETPDRWIKVASLIPGKSVFDVMQQYEVLEADVSDIEAGLVPLPGYLTSSFTFELADNYGFDAFRKRPSMARYSDQERKKGVPWTEEEHRLFLMGLKKHGKGDWRNISQNFVKTKTSTQVASHAQKYFARQVSGGKDKKRPSIHDITTAHLSDISHPSDHNNSPSFYKSTLIPQGTPDSNDGAVMIFDSINANLFMAYPYEIASYASKLQRSGSRIADIGPHISDFQIPSSRYQI